MAVQARTASMPLPPGRRRGAAREASRSSKLAVPGCRDEIAFEFVPIFAIVLAQQRDEPLLRMILQPGRS